MTIREWDELILLDATKGILSCRIYSWISSDAHMTSNPDKNNLLPIFG